MATSPLKLSVEEILAAAPKAELHVHLDGAFDNAVLFRAAMEHIEELPEAVGTPWNGKTLGVRQAIKDCNGELEKFEALVTTGVGEGLFPMLDAFYHYLPIVRGRFALLEKLAYSFCLTQAKQNIIYTEVRYSAHEFLPQDESGSIVAGANATDAVAAVCRGLDRGMADFKIVVKQILCCIASQPAWSAETAALAKEFKSRGVVGVDVASGEMHFDDEAIGDAHRAALAKSLESGLCVTCHCGEVGPAENVVAAINSYGATRVGHGYAAFGKDAQRLANDRKVHFELCPTSSVATGAVDISGGWACHPALRCCKDRTSCSINTDDPTVFRTSLSRELILCVNQMGMSLSDIAWMTLEAIKNAFNMEASQREELESIVRDFYAKHDINANATNDAQPESS